MTKSFPAEIKSILLCQFHFCDSLEWFEVDLQHVLISLTNENDRFDIAVIAVFIKNNFKITITFGTNTISPGKVCKC